MASGYAETVDEESQGDRDAAFEPFYVHLAYEITILADLRPFIVEGAEKGPSLTYVAALEACLVHTRNLIEFLVGRPQEKAGRKRPASDFGADLLLPGWDDPEILKQLEVDKLDEFRYNLDGVLVHMSKRRNLLDAQVDVWVPYINILWRGLYAFAQALTKAGSSVGPRLEALIARR
jgi:hypothetical protein